MSDFSGEVKSKFAGSIRKGKKPIVLDMVNERVVVGGGCGSTCFFNCPNYCVYQLRDLGNIKPLKFGTRHPYNFLCFSASGNMLAAAEWDVKCYINGWIYDVVNDKQHKFEVGMNPTPFGNRGGSRQVIFSPSEKYLLIASVYHDTVIVNVDDLVKKQEFNVLVQFGTAGDYKYVWSPDGKTIATVRDNTTKGRALETYVFPQGDESKSTDILYQSSGYVNRKTFGGVFERDMDLIGLDISPDSRWLAAGGGYKGNSVLQIFDIQDHTLIYECEKIISEITVLKFTPNGKYIVCGSKDGTFTLWGIGPSQLSKIYEQKFPDRILEIGVTHSGESLYLIHSVSNCMNITHISLPPITMLR